MRRLGGDEGASLSLSSDLSWEWGGGGGEGEGERGKGRKGRKGMGYEGPFCRNTSHSLWI